MRRRNGAELVCGSWAGAIRARLGDHSGVLVDVVAVPVDREYRPVLLRFRLGIPAVGSWFHRRLSGHARRRAANADPGVSALDPVPGGIWCRDDQTARR